MQKLDGKFREAALQDYEQDEGAGIFTLAVKLRNICFLQGLYSDSIQTIVSRKHSSFDDIAETAMEEESAIFSKNERHKNNNANVGLKCSNCNKLGHGASRCYLRDKRDMRVSQLSARDGDRENNSELLQLPR